MKRKIRKGLVGLGLLLPSATGLMLFYFIPFCMSVYYSFSKVSGRFVPAGFSNYDSVLGSEAFQVAFRNTFAFLGDRKSTRLNSSHPTTSRMPSSA